MSWLSRTTTSHRFQLAITAIASGAIAVSVVLSFQNLRRKARIKLLKEEADEITHTRIDSRLTEYDAASEVLEVHAPSAEDKRSAALALRARQGDYDDELILEQLARNRVFLTDEGLEKLRSSFIIIVGCGGVGSHAATTLARSGVSKIRLIDFDQVTLSSLNRHAVATLADVGTPKVHCIRKRLEQVTPWVHFDCRNELFREDSAETQLGPLNGQPPDFIVDAIDNIDSKVDLLHYCHSHSLKVISSMGAGCKSDPTRISIADISASTDDPLSKSTRRRLRLKGVKDGIPVVYSSERPGPGKAELLPLPDEEFEKGNVGELSVLKDFRVRILPVLGTMPAIFGLSVANHIMLEISGYPHDYLTSKGREKLYEGVHATLQAYEAKLARAAGKDPLGLRIPLTVDDVGYVVEEVFGGRSAISGLPTRIVLIRWRKPDKDFVEEKYPDQKSSILKFTDLVCMTKNEAEKHLKDILAGNKNPEDVYSKDVVGFVDRRLEEEAKYEKYR